MFGAVFFMFDCSLTSCLILFSFKFDCIFLPVCLWFAYTWTLFYLMFNCCLIHLMQILLQVLLLKFCSTKERERKHLLHSCSEEQRVKQSDRLGPSLDRCHEGSKEINLLQQPSKQKANGGEKETRRRKRNNARRNS